MSKHQTSISGFTDETTDTNPEPDDANEEEETNEFDHTDVHVPRGWTRDPHVDGFAVRNNHTGSLYRVIYGQDAWTFSNEHGKLFFNNADNREEAVNRAVETMRAINDLADDIDDVELTNFADIWQELGEPDETQMEVAWDVWDASQQEGTPIGNDVGALKMLFETWEHTHKTHDLAADEWKERKITRKPGVYLSPAKINGGTDIQNDEELLKEVAAELLSVAEKAADDWNVYGAGKNHDDTIVIFAERDERGTMYDGDHYVAGTPFRECTIMGIPAKWWEHKEKTPSIMISTVRAYREKHMRGDAE